MAVAAHTGIDRKQVDQVLAGFTDVVQAVVSKGEPVAISGFAKFSMRETKAGMRRNNFTGEMMKVKASKKAKIAPLKGFKDSVMTPSAAPKLARGVWPPAPAAAGAKKAAPAKKAPAAKKATGGTTARKTTAKKAPAARKR
jgi:DNA-binding protein HU-beta